MIIVITSLSELIKCFMLILIFYIKIYAPDIGLVIKTDDQYLLRWFRMVTSVTGPIVSSFFLAIGNFVFFILLIDYIVVLFHLNPLHSKCLVITLNEQLTVV